MKKLTLIFFLTWSFIDLSIAQTGPGGIGDLTGNSILQLWLRADTGLIFSPLGRVQTWLDQSGAGNNATSTGSNNPVHIANATNNLPGIRFAGGQYLQAPASPSFGGTTASVFIVKQKIFTGTAISLAPGGISNEMLIFDKKIYHHYSSGNFSDQGATCLNSVPNSAPCIIEGQWGAGIVDIQLYANGSQSGEPIDQQGVQLPLTPANRKITIGQRDQFNSIEFLKGTILEIIGYNVQLTDEQRIAVEDYLACKYNIVTAICGRLNGCNERFMETNGTMGEILNIYPNPASEELNINFPSQAINGDVNLSIVNLLGQTVWSEIMNSDEFDGSLTIPIENLKPGNYLLVAKQEENIYTKMFQVQ